MKRKRILSAAFAVMIAVLSGCGGAETAAETTVETTAETTTETTTEETEPEETIAPSRTDSAAVEIAKDAVKDRFVNGEHDIHLSDGSEGLFLDNVLFDNHNPCTYVPTKGWHDVKLSGSCVVYDKWGSSLGRYNFSLTVRVDADGSASFTVPGTFF